MLPTSGCTARPGEVPIERFRRAEAGALRSNRPAFPPFEMAPRVGAPRWQADCVIEIDSNAYSVPWRLIGEKRGGLVIAGGMPAG